MTELEQPLWRMAKHTFLYPEAKRLPAEIALAKEDLAAMAAVLEQHMAGRTFVVGDSMTVADCATAYVLDWADEVGQLDPFPNLRAYMTRMYARPKAPPRIAAATARLSAA